MKEHKLTPFNELPDWEKKLRRAKEAERIAKDNEKKKRNYCRFTIGDLVGAVFPELLKSDLSEGSVAHKAINDALMYLKEHPDIYQS